MHSLWKGSLSFGLINIPVSLHSAVKDRPFEFHFYHGKDLAPIRYARICERDGKEIAWEDIVKGIEVKKGKIVALHEEDFAKANQARTKTIEIVSFAKESEIDPIYYEKPFFLKPSSGAAKPYQLLRESLQRAKVVGIAKFVLNHREHLGVIKAYDDILLLIQMRFTSEIRSISGLHAKEKTKTSPKEVAIALKLIDHLTEPFHPQKYKDVYEEELKKIIQAKAKGKTIKAKGKTPKATKTHDLVPALQASLAAHKKKRRLSA